MNRIYQAKISSVSILKSGCKGSLSDDWVKLEDWETLVWNHHKLFQDATNYYIVSLLALATNHENRLWGVRENLLSEKDSELQVWKSFQRNGKHRRGLAESITPYLDLGKDATLEECFEKILEGNESDLELLNLALEELLAECNGPGAIQKKGREMLPRFCRPAYDGEFPFSKVSLGKKTAKTELPKFLYSWDQNKDFGDALKYLDFSYFANLNPKGKPIFGERAQTKLLEALDFIAERDAEISKVKELMVERIRDPNSTIEIPPYRGGSTNKESLKLQFFAYLLFAYVDQSKVTFMALRNSFSKPKETKAGSRKTKKTKETDFLVFGDDPLRLARGKRGYVFRAFTSLPCWENAPDITWKEFDIAAFKEALRAFHQIAQKTDERKRQKADIIKRINRMEHGGKWETSEEDSEHSPFVLKGDPRIERLKEILEKDLADEYAFAEGETRIHALNRRTIRGFWKLKEKWESIAPAGSNITPERERKLKDALNRHQDKNRMEMGDAALFNELLKPKNWVIWQTPLPATKEEWMKAAHLAKDEFTDAPLSSLVELYELQEDAKALEKPVRLTPADPIYSLRQFLFSDACKFTPSGIHRWFPQERAVSVPITMEVAGKWQKNSVKIFFSAPRLFRDQILDEGNVSLHERSLIQPMMQALGVDEHVIPLDFNKTAIGLMPDLRKDCEVKYLLNFPVTIDPKGLIDRLGLSERWKGQFVSYNDVNLYLRWPTISGGIKEPSSGWWWNQSDLGSFQLLSIDLGQREAASFSVIEATRECDGSSFSRRIGNDGTHDWHAKVIERGKCRLNGEDASVYENGRLAKEPYGKKGRSSKHWERDEIGKLLQDLGVESFLPLPLEDLIGLDSFPKQNDLLLRCLGRYQGYHRRLMTYARRLKNQETAGECIAQMKDDSFCVEVLKRCPKPDDPALLFVALEKEIGIVRNNIAVFLELLCERILPLKTGGWRWGRHRDGGNTHCIYQDPTKDVPKRPRMGQRGLSMARLEQLESLRWRILSFNRVLTQTPGEALRDGCQSKGMELPEPCEDILRKLDNLKTERINLTAHQILAVALGVRLKTHEIDNRKRKQHDVHGEYEKFRVPVSFIAIEDLSRYLSNQERGRQENSRLMKWCHRAITEKLNQLCEPFGIQIVEVNPSYSSLFCSRTSVRGFRAEEVNFESPEIRKSLRQNNDQFTSFTSGRYPSDATVKRIARTLQKTKDLGRSKKYSLLLPRQGGPRFISADGRMEDADINAAINIGLRAIAAPDNHEILVRIRSYREKGLLCAQTKTIREKARWAKDHPEIVLEEEPSSQLANSSYPNFFVDVGRVAEADLAKVDGCDLVLTSSSALNLAMSKKTWGIVNRINNDRTEGWGLGRPFSEKDTGDQCREPEDLFSDPKLE